MASAQIHDVFQQRLADLREMSKECALSALSGTPRAWMLPSDMTASLFDIGGLHLPSFDRDKINQNYLEIHADSGSSGSDSGGDAISRPGNADSAGSTSGGSSPGRVGDAAALRLQLDYVSVLERSFRARHASRLRCMMHGAARQAGHGHQAGAFGFVQEHVTGMLKAAGG